MAARKYASAESTGTSSTTSTSDQTKVTLTFTPDANSTYAYIWSCQALGDVNYDVRVKLKNNAGTAICSGNHQNNTTNDFIPYSGFAIETFGSSPTSQSITLTYSSEGTITASIKNARIVALKLTSADVYSENTGTSTTSSTSVFTAATTASFTPASAGYYAVLGYCEHNSGSNGGAGRYRVTINDSLSYNSAELVSLVTDYIPNMSVNYSTSLSGSCNIKYEFNSYGGSTVSCRNSKILALRMDEFDYSNIGINNSNNTTTTSTSYVTAETTGPLSLAKYDYMILGCSHYYTTSASIQGHFRWQTDGVTWAESDITNTTLGYGTGRAVSRHTGVYVRSSSIGNSTTNVQYRRDGSTTTGLYNTTLLYLALAPMVNNKARKYTLAESLTTSTTTSTTDQTKVTCTFTPDANSTYAYIWSCEIGNNSGTYDVRVKLKNNAGTEVCATNVEGSDITDFIPLSGFDIEAFGASPTSQSVTLTFSSENTALTSTIRNARVIAIKLSSSDQYVENTADTTTTSTSLQTATTLTFTPASAGDYLILGYCELRSSGGSVTINSQITHNSVAYSAAAHRSQDTTNYYANLLQASVGSLAASSQSITLQFSAGNVNTVNCRNSKLLALRLDQFGLSNITTDTTRTTTTGTTYSTKTTTNSVAMTNGLSYLIVGSATVDTSVSGTLSGGFRFQNGGTAWAECLMEAPNVGFLPTRFSAFEVHSGGTTTTTLDYLSETASVTTGADEVTISILQLDADNLYWVGGSGTWDGSTTTNWSETSGGTGGVGAPRAGTNVFFDSASDSSAPFTVTINAGALANDLTASGLDQTMTWSGSGAMSVYGNFSVPATNFTQSYTGTITFAATSSETITTNGKSFTAFTFDGVGGTWTLQDAATLTGAATLTNGTLVLGSYTFTCDTFASNNSNSRTINFGTDKIVITSTSTATVWNTATITNLTISGTPLVELTGGGATTKTISAGALSEANSISFSLLNTAGTVAFTASNTVRNLIIANNSFTVSNIAITIYGDLTINGTSPTLTAGANAWTFAATSGTKVITTNGETLDFPLTFNGAGGTFELGSDLTIGTSTSRAVVHTNGIVDFKGYNITLYGTWALSQGTFAVTRQLKNTGGGSNKLILTIPATVSTQVFNANDYTSFTTDGNVNIQITGTGLYYMGRTSQGTVTNNFNVQVSSTSGTVVFGDATWGGSFKNLTIDNNSVTVQTFAAVFLGNYTVAGTSPTITYSGATWTWAATSGTQTINLNGHASNTINTAITVNGAGSTLQLQHSLNVGTSTSRTVTLQSGTLDLNGYTLTIFGVFSNSTTTARTLAFGSTGKIILTTTSGSSLTICNTATETNLTVTGTNPLIQVTGSGVGPLNITGTSSLINLQLSPSATATFAVTQNVKDLIIDNSSNITLNNSARSVYGNLTIAGTNPTLVAGASVTTFAATSGTKTITTNGKNLDFPLTFDGVGGTWQLQDALNVGTSTARTVTLTNGTLDLAGYTFTLFGSFLSTNSNARTIAFGSTGKIVLSTTSNTTLTICNFSTQTNLSVTGTNPLIQVTGSGTGPLTISGTSTIINLQLSSTSAATIAVTGDVNNLTIDNNANITLSNGARSIYGDFTVSGTNPTLTAGTSATTFAATSGTKTITTNGKALDFPLTFNGVGGTWQLQDALVVGDSTGVNVGRQVTFTNGTIDLNNYTFTIYGSFVSSNSNTRTIAFGSSGKFNLATLGSTATTVWNCATFTNANITGTPVVDVTGSGTLTRTISNGQVGGTESNAVSFNLLSSAGTITISTGNAKNLVINCSGTSINYGTLTIYGNLTYTAGTTASAGVYTFSASSGTQTINTNNNANAFSSFTINSSSTVQLASSLTLTGSFTLTAGAFDAVTYNVTAQSFASSNSNVRTLSMGSGNWTSPNTGTFWDLSTTTNLTFNKGTANIVNSASISGSVTTFNGGGLTYNNVTLSTNTSTRLDIYGNNTFNTLSVVAGASLRFEAGTTNTFSTFSFGNNSGDISVLDTTTAGVAATLVYAGSSKVRTNYVTVRDITGSPVDIWYMGPNSTNTSNNTNLYFYNPSLYWIGGSGTWDNTNTANWSYFSGGSSAGYYPDQYTDVIFDTSSDSGSSFDIVMNTTVACRQFTVSTLDQAMTLRVLGSSLSIYDNFSVPASNFSFTDLGAPGSHGPIVFAATSTGKTITTNGVSLLEVEFSGVGGGWTLQDNYTATVYTILTAGAITLNDKTFTTSSFTSSGSTARSVSFGTSGKIVLTGATGYPSNREWNVSTATNFTVSGSRRVEHTDTNGILFYHADTAGGAETNTVDLYITSATTGSHNIIGRIRNLDFTGSTLTWTPDTLIIYGNLVISSGMSIGGSAVTLTFAGTVANGQTYQYITTNGKNLEVSNITFSGTAQYVLQDNFNCGTSGNTCLITLTTGTIVMGNYNIIQYGAGASFSSSGSGVRGITSTGGVWKLTTTGTGGTIWSMGTPTNMTNSSVTVELYGSITSGQTKTISPGAGISESNAINFIVDFTGPGTFAISSTQAVKNLTLKDNAYIFSSTTTSFTVYGNLIFEGSTNITFTGGTGVLTFAGSGTQTITTNGETIDKPITLSGTGSYSLGSALTIGSTRLLTYTSGNLVLNGYTLSTGTVQASGTSSRTINHGSNGQFTVVGSGASAFYANGSNITYAGRGMINMTSTTAKTFTANGNMFATLNQGGLGTLTIRTSAFAAGPVRGTSFYSVKNTVSNTTVEFQRKDAFTFTNRFELSGANTTHQLIIQSSAPTGGDPVEGGTYARLMCTNTTPQNIRYVKIENYSTVAAPNTSVTPGSVSSSLYVRQSPKILIPATALFYNDDATTLAGNGSETSNGWNFVREQGFLSFF